MNQGLLDDDGPTGGTFTEDGPERSQECHWIGRSDCK
jgi:hypothetical protein